MAPMPLNKYIAHAGFCSRRRAVAYIQQKKVLVNGVIITEPGYKITASDHVVIDGIPLQSQEMVYILLNKPKNCVTTVSDERGRITVLDIIKGASDQRIYPVGRLDRNSTGLLLLTNDGTLTQKLSHPKYQVQKIYHVTLDKLVTTKDIDQIKKGVFLEDGKVQVDDIAYLAASKKKIKITLHSGKYRVIRRLFQELGYEVIALDRVQYAHFTKRNLPRGAWRYVTREEIQKIK